VRLDNGNGILITPIGSLAGSSFTASLFDDTLWEIGAMARVTERAQTIEAAATTDASVLRSPRDRCTARKKPSQAKLPQPTNARSTLTQRRSCAPDRALQHWPDPLELRTQPAARVSPT
jgi:hypothetical protein